MKNILSIQSHVVYGFAGNKAATFPMQLLGINVWPLNTVNFSNHTQYGKWTGVATPNSLITELVDGIDNIGQLSKCDAILTGYLGSEEQVDNIIQIVGRIRNLNSNSIYLLDPVMGHKEKGCSVAPGVADAIKEKAVKFANIITPNLLELEILTNREVNNLDEAKEAMLDLQKLGPETVILKHLETASLNKNEFEMLMLHGDKFYFSSRPLYKLAKRPVGVGDLIASTFLANIVNGKSYIDSFLHVTNSTDAVIKATYESGEYELQIIAARKEIMDPFIKYHVKQI